MDNIPMRGHCDSNEIWSKITRVLRSQIFDSDLHIRGHGSNAGPSTYMYRFRKKNSSMAPARTPRFCTTISNNPSRKFKGSGLNLIQDRLLVLLCPLLRDSWVIGLQTTHAIQILKLDNIDAVTAYVRVSFSNEDLESKNLYSLIKIDKLNKSLHKYTQEFNNSYSYWKTDIFVKAASYLHIGGVKVGALRAYLMINQQEGK